ncbi:DUF805 domain-containing protein [Nesterenkonia sp. NBAIMH1]|uniref:DUF805 domain-containing protein n=1 Tax=Nesterenkonia sp. NBAIMH1 TaxID=2600320 RepID=UPI0011B5EA03|nr:DUF805 domain-containing protein [Nesterenkonia sp. NBAIMH1]
MSKYESTPIELSALPCGPDKALSFFLEDYAQFKGFSTREEFWWPLLVLLAAHSVIGLSAWMIAGWLLSEDAGLGDTSSAELLAPLSLDEPEALVVFAAAALHLTLIVVTLLPLLAVTWRRLHDSGLPGTAFFVGLIPLVGWLIVLILLARPSAPQKHLEEWAHTPFLRS